MNFLSAYRFCYQKFNEIRSPPTIKFNELIGNDKKFFLSYDLIFFSGYESLLKLLTKWLFDYLIDSYLIQSQIKINSIGFFSSSVAEKCLHKA